MALWENQQDWQVISQINQKIEKIQMNKIRDEKEDNMSDIEEIQIIIRTNRCFTKLENLKEMN